MRSNRTRLCAVEGCTALTAQASAGLSRKVAGNEVCRGCYQRAYVIAKERGTRIRFLGLSDLPVPECPPPTPATMCARLGCDTTFKKGESRRHVAGRSLCEACYQFVWSRARKMRISMLDALVASGKKYTYRTPTKYKHVSCGMPWCDKRVSACPAHLVSESVLAYACGSCRYYLKRTTRRFAHLGKSWQDWGFAAVQGVLKGPHESEPCVMPWCTNMVRRRAGECAYYGPKGEALCNTDRTYLYYYQRRKKITFADAFETAPPPRLLHMRSKK